MAKPIWAMCSAGCGTYLRWKFGQQWNRCPNCDTLNYCEDGAKPGLHPAYEDEHA